jgi:YVTN family beta-propeller protein
MLCRVIEQERALESEDGMGLLWYTNRVYGDFILKIDWRVKRRSDIHGTGLPPSGIHVGSYPFAVSVNPSTNIAYVANLDDDTVSVIDGKINKVTTNITVGKNPYAVSINPSTNIAYVANHGDDTVSVIDGRTNTVTATIPVSQFPSAVSVNPSTNIAYVANRGDNTVSVIDGKTNTLKPIK